MSIPAVKTRRVLTPEQQERLDYADAALALAGHEITDPFARDLLERHTVGELTTEEALQIFREHVLGQ